MLARVNWEIVILLFLRWRRFLDQRTAEVVEMGNALQFRLVSSARCAVAHSSWLGPTREGKFHELKHDECAAPDERAAPRWRGKSIARLSFSSRISCDRSSNSHLRPPPLPLPPPPPTSVRHRRLSNLSPAPSSDSIHNGFCPKAPSRQNSWKASGHPSK